MTKKILLGVGVFVGLTLVVFLSAVAMQSPDYRIARSVVVNAPASEVFPHVNDFHNWEAWSPWAKLDPASKVTFSGESSGKGSVFAWAGNDKVGEGSMTMIESNPAELIQIKLAFIKPMEDVALSQFEFQPDGDRTKVTWSVSGTNTFLGRIFCTLMNMEKCLGDQMETGLANIKSVAEGERKKS